MQNNSYYNEVLTEHNMRPLHKHKLPDASFSLEGVNPSCGDDLTLQVNVVDGIVKDAAYTGSGCAISQASASMMIDVITGKSLEEAFQLVDLFLGMIKKEVTDEDELEALEDAIALQNISNMPARVKCAVLAWHTLREALKK